MGSLLGMAREEMIYLITVPNSSQLSYNLCSAHLPSSQDIPLMSWAYIQQDFVDIQWTWDSTDNQLRQF